MGNFYDASIAKNRVEINSPIRALKGACFSQICKKKKHPSIEMFTDKSLDQVLGIEESSSKCLTARDQRQAPRLLHQDVGNAFPC